MSRLRVAMIAPPWLGVPPKTYGGIEVVIHQLIKELILLDVDVELFSIGKSKIPGVKVHSLYSSEQYEHIHKPIYESMPIAIAHMQYAINYIARDGGFDIIHDHEGFIGPFVMQYATRLKSIPPVLHTLHGPPFSTKSTIDQGSPDNRLMWRQIGNSGVKRLFFVGISKALMRNAPAKLKPLVLSPVYNAINVNEFRFQKKKQSYFLTMGRFSPYKGQHIAAELCHQMKYSLKMTGVIAGIDSLKQLQLELANPLSDYRSFNDFRYYSDKILPITARNPRIKYIGSIRGTRKVNIIAGAKAFLFPILWEEPFGMVVIEALACGTPVVAMNRGAMPEIIKHGVNGFLANSVAEFQEYMKRVDEIDPEACRQSVVDKFSSSVMAQTYLDRYNQIIKQDRTV